jgi:hypothetical protein
MSPEPSRTYGPLPSCRLNFRWNNWRPRRMARNGSRLMIKDEESGVVQSPRPAPISSVSDLAMPSFAAFGALV